MLQLRSAHAACFVQEPLPRFQSSPSTSAIAAQRGQIVEQSGLLGERDLADCICAATDKADLAGRHGDPGRRQMIASTFMVASASRLLLHPAIWPAPASRPGAIKARDSVDCAIDSEPVRESRAWIACGRHQYSRKVASFAIPAPGLQKAQQ